MGRSTLWQWAASAGLVVSVWLGAMFLGLTFENAGGFTCALFSAHFFFEHGANAKTEVS